MHHARLRFGLVVAALVGASSCGDDGGKHTDALVDGTTNVAVLHVDNLTGHFGSVMTGSTSAAMAFTVSNTGVATNTCTVPLAPSATCQIAVTFTPGSSGTKSTSVNIAAMPGGMATIVLDGAGVSGGALSIAASTNNLGGVVVGQTGAVTAMFTVTNTSTAASGVVRAMLTEIVAEHPGPKLGVRGVLAQDPNSEPWRTKTSAAPAVHTTSSELEGAIPRAAGGVQGSLPGVGDEACDAADRDAVADRCVLAGDAVRRAARRRGQLSFDARDARGSPGQLTCLHRRAITQA